MLFIVALAGFSTVLAVVDYEANLTVYIKPNDVVVWTLVTHNPDPSLSFNGKDITEIHAQYWLYTGPDPDDFILYPVEPSQIHYTTKSVDLIFKDLSDFPTNRDATNDKTFVYGTLADGKTFDAYGPGFTYRPH